jgi:hypothetical protein
MDLPIRGDRQAAEGVTMKTRKILATTTLGLLLTACAVLAILPLTASAAPAPARWVGFYVPGAPLDVAPLSALETQVGTSAKVSNYFQNTSQGFTATQAGNAVAHGSIPLITLEFWNPANGVDQPAFSLKAISGGAYDAYLRQYARDAKAFGSEVWLRPLHEMNGNWYPWGGTVNGNSPADFVPAWRHIHDIFAAEGASNVKFVWAPNSDSAVGGANAISAYWPGDAYVDYMALDGYNFGTGTGSTWRTFGDVFGPGYATVTALSAKPLFIAETACSPVGGDKAAWIADMFASIPTRYPRIVGITWFNANKECDWRLECSPSSLAAFTAGLAVLNPPAPSPTATPVYRFYNLKTGTHFYTADPAEKAYIEAVLGATYHLDGVAYTIDTTNPRNDTPLWRFYDLRTGTHFYTADAAEKDRISATMSSTYRLDGPAYDVSMSATSSTPVYRFYDLATGAHFYTADPAEKAGLLGTGSGLFAFDGPAFYLAH